MKLRFICIAVLISVFGLPFSWSLAQESWPQWMGPGRNNVWDVANVIEKFPENGPNVLWRTPVAGGYSGPAVAGDRVYLTDYQTSADVQVDNFDRKEFSGLERIHCLDRKSGSILWTREYPVRYSISYPAGPRCTPVVEGNRIYTLGAEGDLFCLATEDGQEIWHKNLKKVYATKSPLWGYSAHPLLDGDKLITLAGGEGSLAVALNKYTGEEIWRAGSASEQGYSPPTLIEAAGVRQLVLASPDHVSAFDPESGKLYWTIPYQATNGSIIMSPVQMGHYLYVGGYAQKSLLLKLDQKTPAATEVWRDQARAAISPVNVQPIAVGDVLYGFHQNGELCALKIPDGERLWSSIGPISSRRLDTGTAFIVRQSDRFWLFNELGELVIGRFSPQGYEELDRAKVIEPSGLAFGRKVVWSMPAFAGPRIYLRNDHEIICVDVSRQEP